MNTPRYVKDMPLARKASEAQRRRLMMASFEKDATQAAPAAVAGPSERGGFEAWFRQEYHDRLDRNMPDKSYNNPTAHNMWQAWQARAAAPQPPAQAQEPLTWTHEDDPERCISAAQKSTALRDGGASASSVRPYSIPAYTHPAPQQAAPAPWPRVTPQLASDILRLMHLASIGGPRAPNDGGEYNRLVASIRAELEPYSRLVTRTITELEKHDAK